MQISALENELPPFIQLRKATFGGSILIRRLLRRLLISAILFGSCALLSSAQSPPDLHVVS